MIPEKLTAKSIYIEKHILGAFVISGKPDI